jgi:hypothetical protein
MRRTAQSRLTEARLLAVAGRYQEAVQIYADACAQEPLNTPMFHEMLEVKGHFISVKSAAKLMDLQHAGNVLEGKRYLTELLADPKYADPLRLERFGWKTYSQNDEDGIIAEIFRRIGTANTTFFEFGVELGTECNTHLLLHSGWHGAWAEASDGCVAAIKEGFKVAIDAGQLRILPVAMSRENINQTVKQLGLPTDLDLISIDIDFNDYWVFSALEVVRPRVAVIEYNAKFRPPIRHVVPYNPNRQWNGSDYCGASLQSLCELAEAKGYRLVGCNITGVNAFFVRGDLCCDLFASPAIAEHLYQPPRYELFRMGAFEVGHPGEFGLWLNR